MAANVESMFYVRVAPWHGLGVCVEEALSSQEALRESGLDWRVIQRQIMTSSYTPIPGYKANIRETDNHIALPLDIDVIPAMLKPSNQVT